MSNKMKSNVGKALGLFVLWWYSNLIGCLFELSVLLLLGFTIYKIYTKTTSERGDDLQIDKSKNVIVISGCDSGIGQAVAHQLAKKFTVLATVIDTGTPAASALTSAGVTTIKMDFTDDKSMTAALDTIKKKLEGRKLHGVINNAGVCIMGEFDWLSSEQIDKMMKVNLTGPIQFTKELLPLIISHECRLVNVTGIDGRCGAAGLATYCSSKYGMEGFTDSLRIELAKSNVKVITVRPGNYSLLTLAHEQSAQLKEMWSAMDATKKRANASLLDAYNKTLSTINGALSAADFSGIQATFEQIMVSKNPEDEYNEGNSLNILAHQIVSLLPRPCAVKLRSLVTNHLMNIHQYQPSSEFNFHTNLTTKIP